MEEMVTSDAITQLKKENEVLKNRCYALSKGSLCLFCTIECNFRVVDFRGYEDIKAGGKDDRIH